MKILTKLLKQFALLLTCLPFIPAALAQPLSVGQAAPLFTIKTQDGSDFNLVDRRQQGWTVLYFYPKAGTPGCTTQACAYRDAIQAVRKQNAEVFGISTDEVSDLRDFQQKHKLGFTLLSDPDAQVTSAYGVKMPVLKMAKRWTFILDPELKVRMPPAPDRCQPDRLGYLAQGAAAGILAGGLPDAVVQVLLDDFFRQRLERAPGRHQLVEDLGAATLAVEHRLDALELAGHPAQPELQGAALRVGVGRVVGHERDITVTRPSHKRNFWVCRNMGGGGIVLK